MFPVFNRVHIQSYENWKGVSSQYVSRCLERFPNLQQKNRRKPIYKKHVYVVKIYYNLLVLISTQFWVLSTRQCFKDSLLLPRWGSDFTLTFIEFKECFSTTNSEECRDCWWLDTSVMFLITDDPSQWLGGGNSNNFLLSPPTMGKMNLLWLLFFQNGFGSTTTMVYERVFFWKIKWVPRSGNHFRWNVPHDGPIDQADDLTPNGGLVKEIPPQNPLHGRGGAVGRIRAP